ncbi:hypothetical protein F5B20DRAFT_68869 [Whalleya microplaca]|nr:hypothetical protein F5B20DRAFT_68869 [Whalleya microplaca]
MTGTGRHYYLLLLFLFYLSRESPGKHGTVTYLNRFVVTGMHFFPNHTGIPNPTYFARTRKACSGAKPPAPTYHAATATSEN